MITKTKAPEHGASLSEDRKHRFALWRGGWGHGPQWAIARPGGTLMVIGVNPSDATEDEDDPTVKKCIQFAKLLGYDKLVMTNLFSYRTPDPKWMERLASRYTIGDPLNIDTIVAEARLAKTVVAAWGNDGGNHTRAKHVVRTLSHDFCIPLWCWGRTTWRHPKHPSRIAYATPLEQYAYPPVGKQFGMMP